MINRSKYNSKTSSFQELWLGQWRYCTIFIWQFYCQLGRKRLEKGGVGNIHHNTRYCPHHIYRNITGPIHSLVKCSFPCCLLMKAIKPWLLCLKFRLSKRVWNGISMYSEIWHTAQWWYNTNFPLEQFDWHAIRIMQTVEIWTFQDSSCRR